MSDNRMETAGCIVEANVWLRIGLSKAQAKMLKQTAADWRVDGRPASSGQMARMFLSLALSNPEIMIALFDQDHAASQIGLDVGAGLEGFWQRKAKAHLEGRN
jgi:hypothetical protein